LIVGTGVFDMNIHLTPEQERIVNDEVKAGHFRSAEEVIAKALVALREKERTSMAGDSNGNHESAVREMLNFADENRTPLRGVSVKQLIREGHRL
jgi:putative addiction module CopG family antidote